MKTRILMIDDTKSVHAFVKSLLAHGSNIETVSVFNGAEALQLLKSDTDFSVILLDWEMPVMDGPQTLAALMQVNLQIPIIMVSTKNNPSEIMQVLNLGVTDYMMKPFTIDILFDKLSAVLGRTLPYAA